MSFHVKNKNLLYHQNINFCNFRFNLSRKINNWLNVDPFLVKLEIKTISTEITNLNIYDLNRDQFLLKTDGTIDKINTLQFSNKDIIKVANNISDNLKELYPKYRIDNGIREKQCIVFDNYSIYHNVGENFDGFLWITSIKIYHYLKMIDVHAELFKH
jgi:hypothetical protein